MTTKPPRRYLWKADATTRTGTRREPSGAAPRPAHLLAVQVSQDLVAGYAGIADTEIRDASTAEADREAALQKATGERREEA